jgi:hypothetical protein
MVKVTAPPNLASGRGLRGRTFRDDRRGHATSLVDAERVHHPQIRRQHLLLRRQCLAWLCFSALVQDVGRMAPMAVDSP